MSSESTGQPSLIGTGTRAGLIFARAVINGGLLGMALGGGAFFFYLSQLLGPGNTAVDSGGAGASFALATSAPWLVAVLLLLFVGVYAALGVAHGRARAMQHLVEAHGDALAKRLASAFADRIEAMPHTHGTLQRAADWLSVDALSKQLAPVLGEGRAVRSAIAFVLNRLPIGDMLAELQSCRSAPSEPAAGNKGAVKDPALRAVLMRCISETLQDIAAPSSEPLYLALGAHALLLGVGLWLVW
ncbi:conserved membrane hypothetical protein [Cupriavidus taiwanensis]|uniref:hypothetical protein n=1 Tax=Cupriavidus taiwanensis TaxID=164546 RepID=UPI000E1263AC|nr:hypothetical protein [Cupriavidus taiwanensis]SPA31001.1 conserved membrane hypothetical protein [Cupriavidus taiwanensis]